MDEPEMAEQLRRQAAIFREMAMTMPPYIAETLVRAAEAQERRARALERQTRGR